MLATSLTTAVAFGSNVFSYIPPARALGAYAAATVAALRVGADAPAGGAADTREGLPRLGARRGGGGARNAFGPRDAAYEDARRGAGAPERRERPTLEPPPTEAEREATLDIGEDANAPREATTADDEALRRGVDDDARRGGGTGSVFVRAAASSRCRDGVLRHGRAGRVRDGAARPHPGGEPGIRARRRRRGGARAGRRGEAPPLLRPDTNLQRVQHLLFDVFYTENWSTVRVAFGVRSVDRSSADPNDPTSFARPSGTRRSTSPRRACREASWRRARW